jgi:hypothetical protein
MGIMRANNVNGRLQWLKSRGRGVVDRTELTRERGAVDGSAQGYIRVYI